MRIARVLLFGLLLSVAFSKSAFANHSVDFKIINFDTNTATTILNTETEVPGSDNASCNLIDHSDTTIVDNNAVMHAPESSASYITLSLPQGTAPAGWTTESTYYLQCTKEDTTIIYSNEFRYLVAPTVKYTNQFGNLIDIYLSHPLFSQNGYNQYPFPEMVLTAPGWFDALGTGGNNDCEDNVEYNMEILTLCHFDLEVNPQLPSTNAASFNYNLYLLNNNSDQIYYTTRSTNTFSITSVTPQIAPIPDATIDVNDIYTFNGSFTDIASDAWTATVDYGDGAAQQVLNLDGMNFSLQHQYIVPGTYFLNLNIVDDDGHTGGAFPIITVVQTATPTPSPTPEPIVTTLYPIADSYIKQGSSNENEGASTFMRLQQTGHNRGLVRFDESQIEAAVGSSQNYTAKLQFTITDNGNNWGTSGRTIDLHRLTSDWAEGNGFIDGNSPSDRGTGSGVTWGCAVDTNITNTGSNCSPAWNMTNSSSWPFAASPTATNTITNNQSGVVEFDVTSDVQSFISGSNQNYGWLLKKTAEGQSGKIEFGSKESSNTPVLIITKN